MNIDLNDLTIGELEEIEDISGVPFTDLGAGKMPVRAMKALVFVAKRREDPNFTLEDAAKLKVSDFAASSEVDPTDAAT